MPVPLAEKGEKCDESSETLFCLGSRFLLALHSNGPSMNLLDKNDALSLARVKR